MVEENNQLVTSLVEQYKKILGLHSWVIEAKMVAPEEVSALAGTTQLPSPLACAYSNTHLQEATILFNKEIVWDLNGIDLDTSLPHTVIHELVHVMLADIGLTDALRDVEEWFEDITTVQVVSINCRAMGTAIEELCDRLALVLFPLRTAIEPPLIEEQEVQIEIDMIEVPDSVGYPAYNDTGSASNRTYA